MSPERPSDGPRARAEAAPITPRSFDDRLRPTWSRATALHAGIDTPSGGQASAVGTASTSAARCSLIERRAATVHVYPFRDRGATTEGQAGRGCVSLRARRRGSSNDMFMAYVCSQDVRVMESTPG
ncbi:hypothetical protein MCHIJ_50310 [Mycolicibacterium chitae]|nr:hypothetical protein MCHIJ_50310 [Mycolicibacterium chitae]